MYNINENQFKLVTSSTIFVQMAFNFNHFAQHSGVKKFTTEICFEIKSDFLIFMIPIGRYTKLYKKYSLNNYKKTKKN